MGSNASIWLRAAWSGVILATLTFGFAMLNLFDLEKDSQKFSGDLAQFVASPFYARAFGFGHPQAQGRISVVYLDEDSLNRLYPLWSGFPPSYANQAELLGNVLTGGGTGARPRAVAMDFTFLAKGRFPEEFETFRNTLSEATKADQWRARSACKDDEVAKIACILALQGVPVIIGGEKWTSHPAADDGFAVLLESAVVSSLFVDDHSYPLLAPPPTDSSTRGDSPAALLYVAERLGRLRQPCTSAGAFARLSCDAARLFGHDAEAAQRASRDFPEAVDAIRQEMTGGFAVTWSARQDNGAVEDLSQNLTGAPSPCIGAHQDGPVYAWSDAARRLFTSLTVGWPVPTGIPEGRQIVPEGQAHLCPYALSLSYGAWATGPSLRQRTVARLFDNQLVLIGGHFESSNDWVSSPAHGQLPGVQYHAMALDNLLEATHGESLVLRKVDAATPVLSRLVSALLVLALVTVGELNGVMRNDRRRALDRLPGPPDPRRDARLLLRMYLRFLLVDLAVIFCAAVVADWLLAPINWLAITAVALAHGLWAVRDVMVEDLAPLHRDWPPLRAWRRLRHRLSLRHASFSSPPPEPPPTPPESAS